MRFSRISPLLYGFAPSVAVLAIAWFAAVPSARAQPQFELVDLGTLGGTQAEAFGISENGLIVGWARIASGATRAAMWDPNIGIIDLGSPPGGYAGEAVAVNDAGQVAAYGEANPQSYEAFLWENAIWTPTGMLPGNNESIARDIDAFGRIVGQSFDLGPSAADRAILWDAGVLTDLGTLDGGTYSTAYGINDLGQVVGRGNTVLPDGSTLNRGFLWESGQMTRLDPLPTKIESQAFGVNELGDVVGSSWGFTSQFLTTDRATLWRSDGQVIDLGQTPAPPPGTCVDQYPFWTKNIARAINNHGQVVGEAMCVASGAPKAAFLWQGGVNYNLNDLVPPGSGLNLRSARDINDAGQIVGLALDGNARLRAFLVNPVCVLAADVNGDGAVDITDLGALLADFGCAGQGCIADINGDGATNVSDLGLLLAAFGASCS